METALVTGASSGIGRAIALELARRGCRLVLVARREPMLAEVAEMLEREQGVDCVVVAVDLAVAGAAGRLVEKLAATGIEPDVLVNNAGVGQYGPFADADPEAAARLLQLNLVTPTELTRALLPSMLSRGHGRILTVASTAGLKPGPFNAVYAASKAYLISWSEALTAELASSGVSATILCPSKTATEFGSLAGLGRQGIAGKPLWTPEQVARAGVEAMYEGDVLVIPGWLDRLLDTVLRRLPRSAVRRLMARVRS